MSGVEKLSRAELVAIITRQSAQLEALAVELASARERVTELERKLGGIADSALPRGRPCATFCVGV
jgi:hypothetical protein